MTPAISLQRPIHAFCNPLGDGVPEDIQWMPPGRHEILASQDDKPVKMTVEVTEEVAQRMQGVIAKLLEGAESGEGDLPYIDFNHDDGEASGHVKAFFWGGDDPIEGGVRMKVEWTNQGLEGLKGRAWRRFSPSFLIDKAGQVNGSTVNLGGLVNRAAFKTIAPIWSKEEESQTPPEGSEDETTKGGEQQPGGQPPEQTKAMTEEENKRVAALETAVKELQSKLSAGEAENLVLKTNMSNLEEQSKTQAKMFAAEQVRAAVNAGKIPPQNAELIEKWTNLILVDAKNVDLLNSMPVNASLAKLVPNPGQANTTTETGASDEEPFIVKAREYAKANSITNELEAQAVFAGTKEGSLLYKDYRSNYAPAPKGQKN